MDHEAARTPPLPGPPHGWLMELQVAEVLAAVTGFMAIVFCFLNG